MATSVTGDRILVLGAGNFGTCLAQHLAEKGHHVTLWARSPEIAAGINQNRKNPKYLNALTLSPRIGAINNITDDLLTEHRIIVLATAAQALTQVLKKVADLGTSPDHVIICAVKGIEISTTRLPGVIIADLLGSDAGKKRSFCQDPVLLQKSRPINQRPSSLPATMRRAPNWCRLFSTHRNSGSTRVTIQPVWNLPAL